MNDYIFLYQVGIKEPIQKYPVDEQREGTVAYSVPEGTAGHYYARYALGGRRFVKMSNVASTSSSTTTFIKVEGHTVSGKCKITWRTDFATRDDVI